ncbi:kinase [Methylocystis echinoides]|uniref:Kinase n=1 Tax=Methylocystis echinoides TaxID=29468 RepID=A0A9W6GYF0_9HYPH|nr:kinase [Methylocystis echinoides]
MSWVGSLFWNAVEEAATQADLSSEDAARGITAAMAPIIWLLGKTGSGKTSIVAQLTDDESALIGKGFSPCTACSRIYDWPSEAPVLRFLDTRGLGEPGYDPAADMAFAESQAHFLLVTMKVEDPNQQEVIAALKKVRLRHPEWPTLVAQTGLHALYPRDVTHPTEYPYAGTDADYGIAGLSSDLSSALRHQRRQFEGLKGPPPIFVPIDFTRPEDGYAPSAFGLEALKDALEKAGVSVLREAEQAYADSLHDDIAGKAHPLILGYAAATGASGAFPIPIVGVGGLVAFIGLMLRSLADRYQLAWNRARLSEFAAALGVSALLGIGVRYGFRELVKLVPIAGAFAGGALNAVAASALVYAIGRAACVYLGEVRKGEAISTEDIQRAFKRALDDAFDRSRAKPGTSTPAKSPF